MNDNKNSYFALSIEIPKLITEYEIEEEISNNVDLILSGMDVSTQVCKFQKKDNEKIIYLFATNKRKRNGQLVRLCRKFIPGYQFNTDPLTKTNFLKAIKKFKDNSLYKSSLDGNININEYRGEDITILNKKDNWYPWQIDLYNQIFLTDNIFKKADERKIIFLYDPIGKCGKSTFFKWLYFNNKNEVGRITYGSAGQLRSSVINIREKKLYIIDLPRAKAKNDSEVELLNVIEDIKNGFITSPFYGKGESLLMNPPHIIISANYILNQDLLSEDRWISYKIDKSKKKLKDITRALKRSKRIKNHVGKQKESLEIY